MSLARVDSKVLEALREVGATLVRQRKHLVYRLPNGKNFVIASTCSDRRGVKNQLAQLRRLKAA